MLFMGVYDDVRHDFITVWDACIVDYKKWQWSPFEVLARYGYEYIHGIMNEEDLISYSRILFPVMASDGLSYTEPRNADEWRELFFKYFHALREIGRKQPTPCDTAWENLESFSRLFNGVKNTNHRAQARVR